MKFRVAIIGGGPAGLSAGKNALEAGLQPTVFCSQYGGLWNSKCKPFWKSFKTNLSKYTCSFSDLPWKMNSPLFPSQQEVYEYLCDYRRNFNCDNFIKDGTLVTNVVRLQEKSFAVSWTDLSTSEEQTEVFDSVIVASGFFSEIINSLSVEKVNQFTGTISHSNDYVSTEPFQNRQVAIVGASFSAMEIAADICENSVNKVHCILPRNVYVLPRYIPTDPTNPSTSVYPIDLAFYSMQEKYIDYQQDDRKSVEKVFKSPTDYIRSHRYLQSLMGPIESSFDEHDPQWTLPAYVAISNSYSKYVKQGRIIEHRGRLTGAANKDLFIECSSDESNKKTILSDIDDVILCTGFQPKFPFLDTSTLATLHYDPSDSWLPLILYRDILHPSEPGLYFVGMYRGPYFSVMELQAKMVAGLISGSVSLPSQEDLLTGLSQAQSMRAQQGLRRPQFPHGDYVGMAVDLAADLKLSPPAAWREKNLLWLPADIGEHREMVRQQVCEELDEFRRGKHMPSVIIDSLECSQWRFQRSLTSYLSSMSSGTVSGMIHFTAIASNDSSRDILYSEQGLFVPVNNPHQQFDISAYYVFSHNLSNYSLAVFFTDKETKSRRDGLFVPLALQPSPAGWTATAFHQCCADGYQATYTFAMKGLQVTEITIRFQVKGPHKDYESHTILTRIV